jgi:hypothetical protein
VSGSPQTNGAAPASLYPTRFKLVVAAVLVMVAVVGVIAYQQIDTSNGSNSTGGNPSFVERVIPDRDSQLVQQGTVGIDLKSGWDGTLAIDGVAIPEDQLDVTESFNLVQFTPGPDKALRALPIGKLCATATVWQQAAGKRSARPVTWCFEVI